MDVYLKAKGIGLDLPIYTQDQRSARAGLSVLLRAAFQPPQRQLRTTLDDINFDFVAGDRVALIGRNGAGKSTLLKILVGAYPPSRGVLEVGGSRQALLNLTLGFNNEATLIENIILRGIAMGLRPRDASATIDEVLDFSGLEEKAGHRLKTLSAGQRMRLGFALATSVQHQILIMDEWISAGDAGFVEKARQRINSRVDAAQLLVLASHSTSLIKRVCNKAVLIEEGRIISTGSVETILDEYKALLRKDKEKPKPEGSGTQ